MKAQAQLCVRVHIVIQTKNKGLWQTGSPDPSLQREPSGFLSIVICAASISHLPRKGSVETVGVSWIPDLSKQSITSACSVWRCMCPSRCLAQCDERPAIIQ